MSDFKLAAIAEDVLDEHDQSEGFKQRFNGFCETAMEGKAEDSDLDRLIENVELSEGEE
jgi:hypothetical protein